MPASKANQKKTEAKQPEPTPSEVVVTKKETKSKAKKSETQVVTPAPTSTSTSTSTPVPPVTQQNVVVQSDTETSISDNFSEFIQKFQAMLSSFSSLKAEQTLNVKQCVKLKLYKN